MGHLKGGGPLLLEQIQLIDPTIFFLLSLDVVGDYLLISTDSGNMIPASPEMRSAEVPFLAEIVAGHMNSTFALDVPDHLSHRIFGRDGHQHVHMVRHHMAFKHLALSIARQILEYLAKTLAQLAVQCLLAILGNPDRMVFTLP